MAFSNVFFKIKNKKAGVGTVIIILILLILLGLAVYFIFQSGAVEEAIDPCERQFQDCNHGCGEGILSSVCKEKCSYDYRRCKNG